MAQELMSPDGVAAIVERNNVRITGPDTGEVLVFAHGFGCDQTMYRRLLPFVEDRFRVVLFDHVGSGGSSLADYDPVRYGTLDQYAVLQAQGHVPQVSAPRETARAILDFLDGP